MEDKKITATIDKLGDARNLLVSEISKSVIGQREVVDQLLAGIFARGHCLLVGVPGLAKTLLVSTVAKCLGLRFNRIQFTPDLMPSDITGYEILEEDASTRNRSFRFFKGPIFANIVLADEINRTPPKTQAALLQAMQEYSVTSAGTTYNIEQPFFVLATQNPIEQEGTYPLPEAQLDRFMYMIEVNYPSLEEENEIVKLTTSDQEVDISPVLSQQDVIDIQAALRAVPVSDSIIKTAVTIARMSRPQDKICPSELRHLIAWGAGPRAAQYMVLGAKANAILDGRPSPGLDDIIKASRPVMRHRIIPNYEADAQGISSSDLVNMIIRALKE